MGMSLQYGMVWFGNLLAKASERSLPSPSSVCGANAAAIEKAASDSLQRPAYVTHAMSSSYWINFKIPVQLTRLFIDMYSSLVNCIVYSIWSNAFKT